MGKFARFFERLGHYIEDLWAHEPQLEKDVSTVINGITQVSNALNSKDTDIIASIFPNGIGDKTLAEVKALIPNALNVSLLAQDAITASNSIADPTAKANAVITKVLGDVADLPGAAKEAQLLIVISGIVSSVLGITFTQASHLVSAKQTEMQAAKATAAAVA